MKTTSFKYNEEKIQNFIDSQKNFSLSLRKILLDYIKKNGTEEVIKDSFYTRKDYFNMIYEYMKVYKVTDSKTITNILVTKTEDDLGIALTEKELSLTKSKIRSAITDLKKQGLIEYESRGNYYLK